MGNEEMAEFVAPVTVGWYLQPVEAEIARGRLESEGVPAFLHSNNHSQADWPITLALGGIRLQVPSSAAQEAREILQSVVPLPEAEEDISCPSCGSLDSKPQETSWEIAFLVVYFLHLPLPFRRGGRRCQTCDQEWR